MDALVYVEPGVVELQTVPEPRPGTDEVLVRVAAAGICGSDVHGFQGRSRIRIPPMIMGHEFTGRVSAIGSQVEHLQVGQRVVVQPLVGCGTCRWCRAGRTNICPHRQLIGAHRPGAFAEAVTVPSCTVYALPDGLSDIRGTLVEPLSNAIHMLGLGGHRLWDNVVVLGCGPLGLLTAAMARLNGASRVIASDLDARRRQVALALGADEALDAGSEDTISRIGELTQGGATLVIEAVGISATRRAAIALAPPGGTVILLGNSEAESQLPVLDVVNREITLQGSYSCTDEEFRKAIDIMASGAFDAESWLDETTLDHGSQYFRRLAGSPDGLVKVVFGIG